MPAIRKQVADDGTFSANPFGCIPNTPHGRAEDDMIDIELIILGFGQVIRGSSAGRYGFSAGPVGSVRGPAIMGFVGTTVLLVIR